MLFLSAINLLIFCETIPSLSVTGINDKALILLIGVAGRELPVKEPLPKALRARTAADPTEVDLVDVCRISCNRKFN